MSCAHELLAQAQRELIAEQKKLIGLLREDATAQRTCHERTAAFLSQMVRRLAGLVEQLLPHAEISDSDRKSVEVMLLTLATSDVERVSGAPPTT